MMTVQPLVSIIIPNYNSSAFVGRTIQSVLDQTYSNWELHIIDDCSPDNSVEIISEYVKKDSRITISCLEENSGGPATPRNLGLEQSRGKFVCFLDSDDVWHPKKLEVQMSYMLANHALLCSTSRYLFRNDSNLNFSDSPSDFAVHRITRNKLLLKNTLVSSSVVVERHLALTHRFNTQKEFIAVEDYDYYLNLLKETKHIHVIDLPLVYYRLTGNNISKNKLMMARKVRHLLIRQVGFLKMLCFYPFYFLFSFIFLIITFKEMRSGA